MAYVVDSDEDSSNPNNKQAPAGTPPSSTGGGGGALNGAVYGSGAATSQGGAGQSAPTQAGGTPSNQSGQWTNLNSYLNANSDQSGKIGQTVSNYVGDQASSAQAGLTSTENAFNNQNVFTGIDNLAGNTSAINALYNNASQYASDYGTQPSSAGANTSSSTGAGTSSTTGIGGDTGYQQAKDILGGNTGINSSNDNITNWNSGSAPSWSTDIGNYANAAAALQNLQSAAGQQSLLQTINASAPGAQNYNQGQANLDSMLMSGTPAASGQLQATYNQYAPSIIAPQAGTTAATNQNAALTSAGLVGGSTPMGQDLANALMSAQGTVNTAQTNATNEQQIAQSALMNEISNLNQNVGTSLGHEAAADQQYNNAYNLAGNTNTSYGGFGGNAGGSVYNSSGQVVGTIGQGQFVLGPNGELITETAPGQYNTYGTPTTPPVADQYTGTETGAANDAATQQNWQQWAGINALLQGDTTAGTEAGQQALQNGTSFVNGQKVSTALTGFNPSDLTMGNPAYMGVLPNVVDVSSMPAPSSFNPSGTPGGTVGSGPHGVSPGSLPSTTNPTVITPPEPVVVPSPTGGTPTIQLPSPPPPGPLPTGPVPQITNPGQPTENINPDIGNAAWTGDPALLKPTAITPGQPQTPAPQGSGTALTPLTNTDAQNAVVNVPVANGVGDDTGTTTKVNPHAVKLRAYGGEIPKYAYGGSTQDIPYAQGGNVAPWAGITQQLASGGNLNANARAHIANKNFALPGGRYPVENAAHARNALSRVSQFGSPAEKAEVRSKVHSKFPNIGKALEGGGKVPGKGVTPPGTNSYDNDHVACLLSPGEIVIPRSVSQNPNAGENAKKFVEKELKKSTKQ